MKFEFTPEEEWEPLSGPDPVQESAPGPQKSPPHPSVRIAAAAERLYSRARTDSDRLRSSLNRMLYAVENSGPRADQSFADMRPELGVELFRPEAFGPRAVEDVRG